MLKQSVLVAALAALQGTSAQVIEDLVNSVCYPSGQLTVRDTTYPCPLLERTMVTCRANGTTPEHLRAHRDCVCEGSYVDDEFGCLDCLWTHGFRGNQDRRHWRGVLSSASAAFCVPTPTAEWAQVWASVAAATPYTLATVDNELFNKAVGNTRVEIYYNATRLPQGPGPFTPVPAVVATTSATSFSTAAVPTSVGTSEVAGASTSVSAGASTSVSAGASTSVPVLAGNPDTPALGINDGWIRCSGKADVVESSAAPRPSSVKFGNNTLPAGSPGTTVHVTVVQVFQTKCCAVLNADGDVKLSCGADQGIPGTVDRAPAKEVVAELPVFHVPSNGQSNPAGNGMSPAGGSVVGGSPVGGHGASGSNGVKGSPLAVGAPGSSNHEDDDCDETTDGASGAPGYEDDDCEETTDGASGSPGHEDDDCEETTADALGAPGAPGNPVGPASPSSAGSPGTPSPGSGSSSNSGSGSLGLPGSTAKGAGNGAGNNAAASNLRAPASPTFAAGAPGNNSTGGRPVTVSGAVRTGTSVSAMIVAVAALAVAM